MKKWLCLSIGILSISGCSTESYRNSGKSTCEVNILAYEQNPTNPDWELKEWRERFQSCANLSKLFKWGLNGPYPNYVKE